MDLHQAKSTNISIFLFGESIKAVMWTPVMRICGNIVLCSPYSSFLLKLCFFMHYITFME